MKRNEIADLLGAYCILFLLLIAAESFFVFVINWEDWFFINLGNPVSSPSSNGYAAYIGYW